MRGLGLCLKVTLQTHAAKISAHVNGGTSNTIKRLLTGSEDPFSMSRNLSYMFIHITRKIPTVIIYSCRNKLFSIYIHTYFCSYLKYNIKTVYTDFVLSKVCGMIIRIKSATRPPHLVTQPPNCLPRQMDSLSNPHQIF